MNKDYTMVSLPNGEIKIYINTSENFTVEDMCRKYGCATVEELYEKLMKLHDNDDKFSAQNSL